MRSGYKAEGSKLFLAEKANAVYEEAIHTAPELSRLTREPQYKEQAFLFAEKAKGAVLWKALLDSRAKQFAGIPDSLLKKEQRLRVELAMIRAFKKKNSKQKTATACSSAISKTVTLN